MAASPGRVISTPGAMSSSAATTGSKTRASAASSRSRTTSDGQRACASRRLSPRRTPWSRAVREQATTRFALSTASGASGPWPASSRAVVTGQSGHQIHIRRESSGMPHPAARSMTGARPSAAASPPPGAGSSSAAERGRAAGPRPPALTSTRRERSRPLPSPTPVHTPSRTWSRTSAPGHADGVSPATNGIEDRVLATGPGGEAADVAGGE